MPLPNPGMSFTPFDPLPASELNDLVENIEALADGTGLDNGSVTFAKLLSTIFSGQLTTYTNPGTAGGTNSFFYFNLGGIKILYGETAAIATSTASNPKTVTLPASYFSTIAYAGATASAHTSEARAVAVVPSATTTTVTVTVFTTTGTGTAKVMLLVIGT